MAPPSSYATRQREALDAYLHSLGGRHVSAEDIVAHFAATPEPIGRATVYRHLRRLEESGSIQRYVTDGRKASCFRYLDAAAAPEGHFHLQCERCGTLRHIQCHTLNGMEGHIEDEHGFKVNPLRTVFYGICHDCEGTGKVRPSSGRSKEQRACDPHPRSQGFAGP
ncbi:MAG: transcriptional repressor [Coriobacteriales bacterium]|nr:transcriptional repressor [Coriobacteriales bacterium]